MTKEETQIERALGLAEMGSELAGEYEKRWHVALDYIADKGLVEDFKQWRIAEGLFR